MARKRGFFAEIHHQNQLAEKRRRQAALSAARANAAAQRHYQQALRQEEQAHARLARASAADQKQAALEAQRLHHEAMDAEAAARNVELAEAREELEGLLRTALLVEHHVDLQQLRKVAEHPPFEKAGLEAPTPQPPPLTVRSEPVFEEPPARKGFGALLGGKKKHSQDVARAQQLFSTRHAEWEAEVAASPMAQLRQLQEYQLAETARIEQLERARAEYQAECDARETEILRANASLDQLADGLHRGAQVAVEEYVGMVLGNSMYPEVFPVEHDFSYDAAANELSLTAFVPPPTALPTEREFKYQRSKDEVSATLLTLKEQKEWYSSSVSKVALRMLHEVFSADRDEHIQTIALTVETEGLSPATGRMTKAPLVAVAADRSRFRAFDLERVIPSATLQHLGAVVSKSPFDLVPVDTTTGVRRA